MGDIAMEYIGALLSPVGAAFLKYNSLRIEDANNKSVSTNTNKKYEEQINKTQSNTPKVRVEITGFSDSAKSKILIKTEDSIVTILRQQMKESIEQNTCNS